MSVGEVGDSAEKRLRQLGIVLPEVPAPVGSYLPALLVGQFAYTSGQTSRINGVRRYLGKVGEEVSVDDAQRSSRDACINCLSCLRTLLGSLDRISRIVKVVGYVNSSPGFTMQPAVIDGASDLLLQVFGETGRHARSAVGVAELPSNASVELEMIVEVSQA